MTAYTAPRALPVEHIQPGDEVLLHADDTGHLWVAVVAADACDDPTCPVGGMCGGTITYPATTEHYDCTITLTVRIPCEPEPATAPAGPAPGDTVWIAARRRGIEMHHVTAGSVTATRCGRSTYAGAFTVAYTAIERHDAMPCRRCWPVTT